MYFSFDNKLCENSSLILKFKLRNLKKTSNM